MYGSFGQKDDARCRGNAGVFECSPDGILAGRLFPMLQRDPSLFWLHRAPQVAPVTYDPMAAIGSDENYLALHLAFFLAIQKLFSIRNGPVLNFIILDQVTRPYFPDTDYKEIVDLPSPELTSDDAPPQRQLSDEAGKVRRILALLFKWASEPHAPQIIICEKANFRRDPNYQAAIVTFWAKPQGMVPLEWPTET